jgi:NAD(P)-dependent dehydrogenase (short-subunit alcohol dehydrogenase family)
MCYDFHVKPKRGMFRMANIVIGAGSGMGAAVARQLAPGGPLLLVDVNIAAAQAMAEELGGDNRALSCDVSDQSQVDALFAAVDGVDVLVHTAGLSNSMAAGRRILEVNLIGVDRVIRAAEPKLRTGSVGVFLASQSGYMLPDNSELLTALDDPLSDGFLDRLDEQFDVDDPSLAYQASKRGVHRLVRHHAKAWGTKGARIVSVSPGITDTPMGRGEENAHPEMLRLIEASPSGRRGTPEEVAAAIAFLTTPAASLITGSDVLVDGGMATILPQGTWNGKLRAPAAR